MVFLLSFHQLSAQKNRKIEVPFLENKDSIQFTNLSQLNSSYRETNLMLSKVYFHWEVGYFQGKN